MKDALVIEDNHLIAMMIGEDLVITAICPLRSRRRRNRLSKAKVCCLDLITAEIGWIAGRVSTIREICREQAIPVVFITADPNVIKIPF